MGKKRFLDTSLGRKLNSFWKLKLHDSGFDDVDPEDGVMIQPQVFTAPEVKTEYVGGPDYHEFCHQILREYQFRKDIHRRIFELHTEGFSQLQIQDWIIQNTHFQFTQVAILKIIRRIRDDYKKG